MQQDQIQKFVNKQPFTVFVLGAGQTSVPIGVSQTFLSNTLFSSQNVATTAMLTVEDLMDVLVHQRVIPAIYCDVYMLSYGCVGPLRGSSVLGSLGVGSLSHFTLRAHVCGGVGELFLSLCYPFH